jgi:hypothetical protein
LFPVKTVRQAPQLAASGRNVQVQAAAVKMFLYCVFRLQSAQKDIREFHIGSCFQLYLVQTGRKEPTAIAKQKKMLVSYSPQTTVPAKIPTILLVVYRCSWKTLDYRITEKQSPTKLF